MVMRMTLCFRPTGSRFLRRRVMPIMPDDDFCYVATDPEQPGAAFAMCVDKPEFAK
jgi:hypothetical protein